MSPNPPYYAIIFTSIRRDGSDNGYAEVAARMEELARQQPGFLGVESVRGADGLGITISYWATLEAVAAWGRHAEHILAQQRGRAEWYDSYTLRVCKVESAREFTRNPEGDAS